MEKNQNKLSIIIYSCEKNSDMWKYFSILFRKYWSNCPYQVILVTDKFKYHQPGIYTEIPEKYVFDKVVVDDSNWAHMMKSAIKAADTPFVSLWMDDYLLCDRIENDKIEELIQKAKEYHVGNLRLSQTAFTTAEVFEKDDKFLKFKQGTAYSISTQVGIWSTDFLLKYIKDDWSPWDFERVGSLEIKSEEYPMLGTRYYAFPYEEGVRQGKWMENGIRLCQRNGIKLDFDKRPPLSNWENAKMYFKGALLDWNPDFILKSQNLVEGIKQRIHKK